MGATGESVACPGLFEKLDAGGRNDEQLAGLYEIADDVAVGDYVTAFFRKGRLCFNPPCQMR